MEGRKIKKNTRGVLCGRGYSYSVKKKSEARQVENRIFGGKYETSWWRGKGKETDWSTRWKKRRRTVAPFLLFLTSCSQSVDPPPNTQP